MIPDDGLELQEAEAKLYLYLFQKVVAKVSQDTGYTLSDGSKDGIAYYIDFLRRSDPERFQSTVEEMLASWEGDDPVDVDFDLAYRVGQACIEELEQRKTQPGIGVDKAGEYDAFITLKQQELANANVLRVARQRIPCGGIPRDMVPTWYRNAAFQVVVPTPSPTTSSSV